MVIALLGAILIAIVFVLSLAYSSANSRAIKAENEVARLEGLGDERSELHNEELRTVLNEVKIMRESLTSKIGELATDGLTTDGGHHKQWFLEEIAKLCGVTEEWLDANVDRGIIP